MNPAMHQDALHEAEPIARVENTLASSADRINDLGFGEFFGAIQRELLRTRILQVARMYDPPNPRFPSYSLPAILEFMEAHADDLASKLGQHRMDVGDSVYGRRGDIGRRAFIGRRQAGWFCGTGCLRIRPDPQVVNPRYLFDILGSPDTAGTIANRAKGATVPNLNGTVLESVLILAASRGLQDHYVEQVEPLVEMLETLAEQAQKLRAARDLLLPHLMSGELAV